MIRYGIHRMFVSGLFCKPIFVLFLSCGIRVASKSSVDSIPFPKRCSHTPMWIPILHDNRDCLVNPFQPACFSSSGSDHVNIRKINSKFFLNSVCFIRPKLPLFSCPPTLFIQGLRFLNQVSILWMWSLSILFHQCSYPVVLLKILTELKFIILCSFPSPVVSMQAFGVDHIFFFGSHVFHVGSPYRRLSYLFTSRYSIVPECWRYLERFTFFHSQSVQVISRGISCSSHLNQLVQSIFSRNLFQRCFFWVGPNPQVFSQDLTWLF